MIRKIAIGSTIALLLSMGAVFSCGTDEDTTTPTQSVALAVSGHLTGAVFTTTSDGSRVNANIYPAKEDVYLDGGPGPNAPAKAAGLPEGEYFFQVTDPSGKDLLSTDHISCRHVYVNDEGVIEHYFDDGKNYVWNKGSWQEESCQHELGTDQDHSELGAITVQLMPYDDTPNRGGVYKVWMTRTGDYAGDPNFVPVNRKDAVNGEGWEPANAHGFIPAFSKTDNYKVKGKPPCDTPGLLVRKFHDTNLDGAQGTGEVDLEWGVTVAFPNGTSNHYYTPETLLCSAGDWAVVEDQPEGTIETASILNGELLTQYPNATPEVFFTVDSDCKGEQNEVVFGNVGTGEVTACKVYDRNTDGVPDETEPGVPGFKMTLSGTDVTGAPYGPVTQVTGTDGCTTFGDLLPGEYTLSEMVPETGSWQATGATSTPVTIESVVTEDGIAGTVFEHEFTNVCTGSAAFGTKGYWHNKNGLAEVTTDDVAMVNTLAPYSTPSSYFGAGDEPFDGLFENGTPVGASNGVLGEIAPAGTALAEFSQFLVDANAGGDPREQLAQQLLAFVMNTEHRLDGPGAAIEMPDGTFVPAGQVIDDAIGAWLAGTGAEQNAMSQMLDAFNNDPDVHFLHWEPCTVEYP